MSKQSVLQRITLFTAKLKCKAVFSCDFNGKDIFVFGGEDGFCEVLFFFTFSNYISLPQIFRLKESTLTKIAEYNALRSVNSVRFSPDGQEIALGLSGGYVNVINLKGERLQDRKFNH